MTSLLRGVRSTAVLQLLPQLSFLRLLDFAQTNISEFFFQF